MEKQKCEMICQNENSKKWFIFFAVITTSLTAFGTGSCFVWTSPLLPKLSSNNSAINPIGQPSTTTETSWIVSALSLGLIVGPSVSIVCLKFSTKKISLLVAVAPMLTAHIICCFASSAIMFIVARLLMGIATGAIWAVLGTYIGEISEDSIRGLLGSIPGIMSNFGSLLVYLIGPYLAMTNFSIAILIPLVLFYVGFGIFVPDSPYDLLMKGKYTEAELGLKKLRRKNNVDVELKFMQETIRKGNIRTNFVNMLKNRTFRKGLMICVTLMTIQQVSGILAVVSYAEVIFKLAGDFIPSSYCPMILGVVGTIANIVSSYLADRMGRKLLLTISCIFLSISLLALGLYFYILEIGLDVSKISWLPIVSLIVYMVAFNIGLGIVPWIITGEVFHSSVKSLASTITALTNFTMSFLVTLCYPYMTEYLGMGCTFGTFGIFMVLGIIFCVGILPETKGKNFQEIQKILNG